MARTTVRHEIVTEEKWDKVLNENKELLNDFLNYMSSVDRSPQSIKSYESDLKIFMIYFMEHVNNKWFRDIKKRDVMNYQNYLVSTLELSPARVRRLRASISSLSNFCMNVLDEEPEWKGFLNIINRIPAPARQDVREKTIISNEQYESLVKYYVDKKDYQRACFLACLKASGVRKGEIILFKVSFFDEATLKNGMYKTPKIRTKGHGKLGKQMEKYIIKPFVKEYFDLWMKQREELGIDCDELFVIKRKGQWQPIKISTVDSWCEQFGKILNVNFYPHLMRHFFVSYLLANNFPLSVVRDIVGHESSSTTEIYNDLPKEDSFVGLFNEDGIIMQEKQSGKIEENDNKSGNGFSR